jgi:hypothetical protein
MSRFTYRDNGSHLLTHIWLHIRVRDQSRFSLASITPFGDPGPEVDLVIHILKGEKDNVMLQNAERCDGRLTDGLNLSQSISIVNSRNPR